MKMKAIVLWQPWASLVACGAKPFEFRSWSYVERPTGVRPNDRIAIAAGKRPVKIEEVSDLMRRLHDPERSTGLDPTKALPLLRALIDHRTNMTVGRALVDPCPKGVLVCTATIGEPKLSVDAMPEWAKFINDSDRLEHSKWAWPMLDVKPCEPVQVRGAQGFFWVNL